MLRDFNNKKQYIYVQFDLGGYAIYDREGEFIYERAQTGNGPFSNCKANDKLYYGGPTNYFVKEKGNYRNIITDEVVSKSIGKQMTAYNEEVKEKNIQEKAIEQQLLKDVPAPYKAGSIFHYLGENLEINRGNLPSGVAISDVQDYFFNMASETSRNNDGEYKFPVADYGIFGGSDAVFGLNQYGSCSVVALGMVMQFYDRLGIKDLVPEDTSNFTLKYNYNVFKDKSKDDWEYYKLSRYRSQFRAEVLHQELIDCIFADSVAQPYNDKSFGVQLVNMKSGVNTYCERRGISSPLLNDRKNDTGVEDEIKKGNPVMISFSGEYRLDTGEVSSTLPHSPVAFAYSSNKTLWWETTKEYIINFGWYSDFYGSVYIAKNLVSANMSFAIL